MRRAAVAAVTGVSLALGAAVGVQAWTAADRREQQQREEVARARVGDALAVVRDDTAARVEAAGGSRAADGSALLVGARGGLDGVLAQASRTLDGSAGRVGDDDAPRVALAGVIDEARAAVTAASPREARRLTAALASAEQVVLAAVAAQEARDAERRAAEQEAARAASAGASRAPAPSGTDRCATTYSGPAFWTSVPTEGGDGSNGRLPPSALTAVSWTGDSRGTPFFLRSDAAAALERLNVAFRAALGHDLALDLTYRDLDTQVAMREALGSVAAVPGTSSHGTGLAIDVPELPCAYGWDSAARAWLVANGPAYGWVSPAWAQRGGSNPEYWHYEYRG